MRCGGDVDRRQAHGPRDCDRMLQVHRRRDVHRVRADVHLRRDGNWVGYVVDVSVHS